MPSKGIDVNSFTDFMLIMSKECNQSVDELSKSFTEALKTISTIKADATHIGDESVRSRSLLVIFVTTQRIIEAK